MVALVTVCNVWDLLARGAGLLLLIALLAATNVQRRDCGHGAEWRVAVPFFSNPLGCEQHTWLRVQSGRLGLQSDVE